MISRFITSAALAFFAATSPANAEPMCKENVPEFGDIKKDDCLTRQAIEGLMGSDGYKPVAKVNGEEKEGKIRGFTVIAPFPLRNGEGLVVERITADEYRITDVVTTSVGTFKAKAGPNIPYYQICLKEKPEICFNPLLTQSKRFIQSLE